MIQQFTYGYPLKRTESRDSDRYLYTHVYTSIIHISQDVETKYLSSDKRINKMCYAHTMEYYLALKEGNHDTCYDPDENLRTLC